MNTPAPILEAVARRFERSQAGRTGNACRDLLLPLDELLAEAGCSEGERRAVAEQQLGEAENAGILTLVPLHKRDRSNIYQVRFSPGNESTLYARLGRSSPAQLRAAVAEQFNAGASADIPARWRERWCSWCERMRQAASEGSNISPFDREPTNANSELIALLPRLLAWEGESLVRFASCVLCQDSKRLEEFAALEREGEFAGQLRGKLGRMLEEITGGIVHSLDDLGIIPNPRSALVHGPLKLCLNGAWLDLGILSGPFRLSQTDIARAEKIETASTRCLTVENETTFYELAKLQAGELLICTSYPGSGTVALLKRLPLDIGCWHFGDSDKAGFDILRVLRERTGRSFQPLHMQTGKIPFEQESLGRPNQNRWPFYG